MEQSWKPIVQNATRAVPNCIKMLFDSGSIRKGYDMRRWTKGFWMAISLLVLPALVHGADEAPKPQYIGSMTCAKICHKTKKQGVQLRLWQESAHAKAWETLAGEKALAIAKKMGIDDPQKSDQCVKCHTTAHGVSAELLGKKFSHEEGVGCEACHGPGSLYKKRSVMKSREKSVAMGLLLPDEKTCLTCHNEESPTYKPFNYDERWSAIVHPKPEAKPAAK